MKKTIRAKAGDFKFGPLKREEYIFMYEKFDLRCEIIDAKFNFLSHDYILLLDGKKDDIDAYISFLQIKGFSIK